MADHGNLLQWQVTFEGVTSPTEMQDKLEKCLFLARSAQEGNPFVVHQAEPKTVTLTFYSTLTRQGVMKKCSEVFKKCGKYTKHTAVDLGDPPISMEVDKMDRSRDHHQAAWWWTMYRPPYTRQ